MPSRRSAQQSSSRQSSSQKNSRSADLNVTAAASSPEWVAGDAAVFKTPGSLSIPSGPSRRTSVYLRRLHSPNTTLDFQGGFSLPDVPSPKGMVTRSRRSSVYVSSQKQGTRPQKGRVSKLPKTRGQERPKTTSAPPSKIPHVTRRAETNRKEELLAPQPSAAAQNGSRGKRTRSKEPGQLQKTQAKKLKVDRHRESPAVGDEAAGKKLSTRRSRKSGNLPGPEGDVTGKNGSAQDEEFQIAEKKTNSKIKTAVASATLVTGISPKSFYKTPPKQPGRKKTGGEESPFTKIRSSSEKTPKARKSLVTLTSTPVSTSKAIGRGKTPLASKLRNGIDSPALKSSKTPLRVGTPSARTSTPINVAPRTKTPHATTPRAAQPKSVTKSSKTPLQAPVQEDEELTPLSPMENLSLKDVDMLPSADSQIDHEVSQDGSADNSADVSANPSSFRLGCLLM